MADVPLHALDSVNVPVSMEVRNVDEEATNDVKVIPMQEELEVRLEETSFQADWPYVFKMDPEMMTVALQNGGTTSTSSDTTSNGRNSFITNIDGKPEYIDYKPSGNQVKLELEVTLTPETVCSESLVTSTLNSSSTSTSSQSVNKNTVATVIPPTTIVCLPSVVATSASNFQMTQIPTTNMQSISRTTAMVPSSSAAVPYLTLSTSQPIRAVPQHKTKSKQSSQSSTGNGGSSNRNRNASNKPPPGK